jgi:hypothetical protein
MRKKKAGMNETAREQRHPADWPRSSFQKVIA